LMRTLVNGSGATVPLRRRAMLRFLLLVSLSVTSSFSSAATAPSKRRQRLALPGRASCIKSQADWASKLIDELEDAAKLAQRGGAISDVLRKARSAAATGAEAAKEADKEMTRRLAVAEERAAKALMERDAANARATAAESAMTQASDALKETERALAEAEANLDRYKSEAAAAMGQLDDAYEFEQDRVNALRKALEEQKRALKEAKRESQLAAAREASASADAANVKREKTEVELRLEEERQLLEGCLVDAKSENDALLCRALVAEARIGKKRRAVKNFVKDSKKRLSKLPDQIRNIKWSGDAESRQRAAGGSARSAAAGSSGGAKTST